MGLCAGHQGQIPLQGRAREKILDDRCRHSLNLKPAFLCQLSQTTGKFRVWEGVLSKTLTHDTYVL